MSIIYKITNIINNKCYIGKTKRKLKYRWKEHCVESFKEKRNFHFYNAIKKYSINNWTQEIIEEVDDSILNDREIFWISYFDTFNNGYNSTSGGDSGYTYKQSTKNKISKIHKGKILSDSQKLAVSKAHKGKSKGPFTKEHLEKLSKTRINKISVKDKDGNKFKVKKDDPRWLSGELVGHTKGIKRSKEDCDRNSNLIWINNDIIEKRTDKNVEVPEGWTKGRIRKNNDYDK